MKKKLKAFTLAEVLITLAIVGVVAALTLPNIIVNYQQRRTVSLVKKFYNNINVAVNRAVADYGDVSEWMGERNVYTYQQNLEFLSQYILPYIIYDKIERCSPNHELESERQLVCVTIPYGMFSFRYDNNGGDFLYFVNGKYEMENPRSRFTFMFNKNTDKSSRITVEPYVFAWSGEYATLKSASWGGCSRDAEAARYAYCTKWIQVNNWEIPEGYPW